MHIKLVFQENDLTTSSSLCNNLLSSFDDIKAIEMMIERKHLSLTRDNIRCPPWYCEGILKRLQATLYCKKLIAAPLSFTEVRVFTSETGKNFISLCCANNEELNNLMDYVDCLMEAYGMAKYYMPRHPHVAIASFEGAHVPKRLLSVITLDEPIILTVKEIQIRDSQGKIFIV